MDKLCIASQNTFGLLYVLEGKNSYVEKSLFMRSMIRIQKEFMEELIMQNDQYAIIYEPTVMLLLYRITPHSKYCDHLVSPSVRYTF